jgi:adenine-specific DNA-methyltransferase
MSKRKTKLELTWIGKDNRPKLEPRILIEDPNKSYHAAHRVTKNDIFDNLLIFGDNLLALKALEQDFTGEINCIYIDPPFNTQQAFEHYEDGVEHSVWLSLMRDRFELFFRLLADTGLLWIHLDDSEMHYCKVLLDQIFGRQNFVTQITYERSGAAGLGQGGFVVNTSETLLLYKKSRLPETQVLASQLIEAKTMKRYNRALVDEGKRQLVREFKAKSNDLPVRVFKHSDYEIQTISMAKFADREEEIRAEFAENFDKLFRGNQIQKENEFQRDLVDNMDKMELYSVNYVPSRGKNEGQETTLYYYNRELFAWLKDTSSLQNGQIVKSSRITTVWSHAEIPKADIANEGGVKFPRGKKPEQLIRRIIEMSCNEGDWVLDSFAGSGTTGAVAHKMRRRWIMIELGDHCHTHIIPRLQNVIDGKDSIGITKAVNWTGGGGFRYFKLGPSLIVEDEWGNPVINPQFNAAMLAEAMCKIEGFIFDPHPEMYWQQGKSTETDFIYVTTQFMTKQMLAKLSDEVGPNRSLLICCSAFRCDTSQFDNLTVKKIPKAVLMKCEWGHDDYSLEVRNLPDAPPELLEQQLVEPKRQARKFGKDKESSPTLFDIEATGQKGPK